MAMMAVRVLGGTNPRGRDSTSEPAGCYRVREMTKIGQVASVELGVSCWCLGGHRPEADRTSDFSRDTRNLNFYVRSLAL